MLKKIFMILLFNTLLFSDSLVDELSEKKEFLIVKSTTSYQEAKKYAEKISQKLKIELDLRGLTFHKGSFLTESKEICEEHWGEGGYPCYLARGREDGTFVSVEHSNEYEEFTNGYYIVVVATGQNLSSKLKKVKKVVKDAYIKTAMIYMGCLH